MAISRADLLKELMPGLNAIFDEVYQDAFNELRLVMPRQGRYQIWKGHHTLLADRIKHRREALAVMKLLKENKDGTSRWI